MNELNRDATIEEAATYLVKTIKTTKLIEMLAKSGKDWNQDDCNRACAETGTFHFTVDDVLYIRFWQNDEAAQDCEKTIDYLLKEMANRPAEARLDFYDSQIKPHNEWKSNYRAMLRHNFKNLEYYAE